jgi:chorismate lyase/3-hydroxybenzoate synthase
MTQPRHASTPSPRSAPRVSYRAETPTHLLGAPGTLAVIGFGAAPRQAPSDPRLLHVALPGLAGDQAPLEHWQVDAEVTHGREGIVRHARGGGWLLAAV